MERPLEVTVQMIDACLRGEDASRDVLNALNACSDLPPQLAAVVHELQHFADDDDVRARDPEYADYWRERLVQMRGALIQGA